ncbi:hypothetical protein L6452_39056 [Arctium lappa]|uniref:Uncharacterized protein n=1 Tax=Arctium lappa TaxID=4217 RepID=A0ACB8XQM8_ARCLA|nr:hypothetical protein L6452_39056 [Arctium lappa]
MTMRNSISMNILCVVTGIIILSMITQFSAVACRTLRTTQLNTDTSAASITTITKCEHVHESDHTIGTELRVSSCNKMMSVSSFRLRMRALAYKLASGPSRRGAGH